MGDGWMSSWRLYNTLGAWPSRSNGRGNGHRPSYSPFSSRSRLGCLLFYFCYMKKPELLFRLIGRFLKLAHLVRLRRRTWASPTTPLPRRRSDEGSGVTTTPEIPDTRGCRKSSNPPAESIVTLTIVSLLMVVMVRKLLPFVLPYGPKLNTVPSPIVTLMFRSLSLAGLNGFKMKSRKVCPGTVNVMSFTNPSMAVTFACPEEVTTSVSVVEENCTCVLL